MLEAVLLFCELLTFNKLAFQEKLLTLQYVTGVWQCVFRRNRTATKPEEELCDSRVVWVSLSYMRKSREVTNKVLSVRRKTTKVPEEAVCLPPKDSRGTGRGSVSTAGRQPRAGGGCVSTAGRQPQVGRGCVSSAGRHPRAGRGCVSTAGRQPKAGRGRTSTGGG